MTPYARLLIVFKSKKELVSCIRDIIQGMLCSPQLMVQLDDTTILTVLQLAAKEGVLYWDCSLNNMAIEDLEDSKSSHSLLLDWESSILISRGNQYGLGGTVS